MKVLYSAALVVLVGCAGSLAARSAVSTYECANGKSFSVRKTADGATVEFENEVFTLSKRKSSLGSRYSSDGASLVIDGDLAVFASETVLDLRMCSRSHS